MYLSYFGLSEKPFALSPDPRFLYMSSQHWEAMAHLMYGLEDDWGFVLVTGEIGTGKTTLCRMLLEQMPEDIGTAFIINPKVSPKELLVSVCDEFHIKNNGASSTEKELTDLIHRYLLDQHAAGRKSLLIIDEAQYLTTGSLDQLRLLTNLETNDCKLLRIILLGQPELRDVISRPEMEQMSQRITARYHIGRLPGREIREYVARRLSVAGGDVSIFRPSALRALKRLSGGVPRLINVICDRALLGAFMGRERHVSRSTLIRAAHEVLDRKKRPLAPAFSFAAVAIVLIAAVVYYLSAANLPRIMGLHTDSGAAEEPVSLKASTKEGAYRHLLSVKGISYDSSSPEDGSLLCSNMELFGMDCRTGMDKSKDLSALQLPAVIGLNSGGGAQYATLMELKDGAAVVYTDTGRETVPIRDLVSAWTGEYMMLEQSEKRTVVDKKDEKRSNIKQAKGQR